MLHFLNYFQKRNENRQFFFTFRLRNRPTRLPEIPWRTSQPLPEISTEIS
jgi:hypothetical protein